MIEEYNEWLDERKLSDDEIKSMWKNQGWDVIIKHGKPNQPKGWTEIWPVEKDKKRFMKELGVSHASMINEAYKKPQKLSAAQGGPTDQEYMARLYLPKIKKTKDKSGLDRIFKQFERAVKSLNLSSDDIDLMQSWFEERSKELGLQESYELLSEEQMYRVEIRTGVYPKDSDPKTWKWMSLDDAKFDKKGKRYTKKEAEKVIKKAIKAGRAEHTIRMIKESLNEAPIAAKGWDKSSIEKFGETIGKDPKEKGFFDACVKRMEGKEGFDNEKARGFCASIKDAAYDDPHWRGKGKTKKEVEKDTAGKEYKKK